MRLGFVLPHIGPAASPAAIIAAARRAEELGYDSLWVTERLLYPLAPRTPYPAAHDGVLPEAYRYILDPLGTLTLAAAHTERIALGTSVLDIPYHNPVILARSLATIDIISGGRLRVGLGVGWSVDEFEAAGASMAARGRRADEFLGVLKAVWGDDPVEFNGEFYQVAPSIIGAKPVQRPHPPLYLAAYAPTALQRAATLADGWNPAGIPVEGMAQMSAALHAMARDAGRDPDDLAVVVRANLYLTDEPIGGERFIFTGSRDQIADDIAAVRAMGAAELFFDTTFTPVGATLDGLLQVMGELRELAREESLVASGR
ncbi:MAG TPA: LLM class F420-dependent oxidoreductase [Thermomicrobiales bacterium]|jgi:probable F420-dependent oxidoreductase